MPAPFHPIPALWIRTAAGPETGFGHLKRSLILARQVEDCAAPLYLVDPGDRWVRERVEAEGGTCVDFDPVRLWSGPRYPSAILVDTRDPRELHALIGEARRRGIPVLSIQDLGLNPLPADVVVDGSLARAEFESSHAGARLFTGPSYLVLDPTLGLLRRRRKPIGEKIEKVVVNLGGGDSSRFFPKVLEGLRLWRRPLNVVGLPGFTEWGQQGIAEAGWQPLQFCWAGREERVEELLFAADLAITAGGLSAYESLCIGTPLVAVAWDAWQQQTISSMAALGACVDLGLAEQLRPVQLPGVLSSLDQHRHLREGMSARGRRVVDGRGAERVGDILRSLIGRPCAGRAAGGVQ